MGLLKLARRGTSAQNNDPGIRPKYVAAESTHPGHWAGRPLKLYSEIGPTGGLARGVYLGPPPMVVAGEDYRNTAFPGILLREAI